MPYEVASFVEASAVAGTKEVHQIPVGPPPTPAPLPSPQPSANSLELHIPIPIPTPPTPLPIVIAYPLSVGPITPASEPIPLVHVQHSNRDTMQSDDSGIELEPVPGPVRAQKLQAENSVDSEETLREMPIQENEYEVIEMTDEERLDASTVYLFRALNVPLNIRKLRAMRAKGRLPAPLLKFKYGPSRPKHTRSAGAPGKENDTHLASIFNTPGTSYAPDDDPNPESPTETETVQGESWYLPSATARRIIRQSSRYNEEREARNWESPYRREFRDEEIPAFQPIVPNQALFDQPPLPPASLPSVVSHPELHIAPLPPTPSPTPAPAPSPSGRPLGYMYAKPIRRAPSCKSCGGGGSPANSAAGSRTLTPAPPSAQGVGAYYAYDFLTPSPGILPYSAFGSSRSVSLKYPASLTGTPVSQRYIL